ncbi:hypothetical protein PGB90_004502 [Kerria lacca]
MRENSPPGRNRQYNQNSRGLDLHLISNSEAFGKLEASSPNTGTSEDEVLDKNKSCSPAENEFKNDDQDLLRENNSNNSFHEYDESYNPSDEELINNLNLVENTYNQNPELERENNEESENEYKTTSTTEPQHCFDICGLQVIGDLTVYSLARMLGVQTRAGDGGTLRHFFSAFEFITVEYLATHVSKLSSVRDGVILSTGLSDQVAKHKSNATRFGHYLKQLFDNLYQKGARWVVLIIPPPHPRTTSIVAVEFYQEIRKLLMLESERTDLKITIVNIDDLFFKQIICDATLVREMSDGSRRINMCPFSSPFTISSTLSVYISTNTAREILERVKISVKQVKKHSFSPNQILGIDEISRDPTSSIQIRCPDPIYLAADNISNITENVENYSPKCKKKSSSYSFIHDEDGAVRVYTDGAVINKSGEKACSSFSIWFGLDHPANQAKVTIPTMTNNQAEIFAVIKAAEIAAINNVKKLTIFTDSRYIVDQFNEGLLDETNPSHVLAIIEVLFWCRRRSPFVSCNYMYLPKIQRDSRKILPFPLLQLAGGSWPSHIWTAKLQKDGLPSHQNHQTDVNHQESPIFKSFKKDGRPSRENFDRGYRSGLEDEKSPQKEGSDLR